MAKRLPDAERSRRQTQIIEAIRTHRRDHDYGPTVRELMDAVGLRSRATTQHLLADLKAAGKVGWDTGKARTLRVTDDG